MAENGQIEWSSGDVREFLDVIADLLYLFDYYADPDAALWPLERMRLRDKFGMTITYARSQAEPEIDAT